MPGRHNSSSIDGGIFGETPIEAPKLAIHTMGQFNSSSVQGGIFAEPEAPKATPRTSQITSSSMQGGIFYDNGSSKEPLHEKSRIQPELQECAGKPVNRAEGADIYMSDAPLQPLMSARANNNASSVEGGIFSKAAPTPTKQPRGAARDRNASSISGGIFG